MRVARDRVFSHNAIYFVASLASLLLAWIRTQQIEVINPDAICYLLSAQAMQDGLHQAMNYCGQAKWPFYSILIYGLAHAAHFPYLLSAYVLDTALTLFSVITFILIVKELGGTKKMLWLACGVILLSYHFNSVRQYIIRDHGYWAFYLLSIFLLLRYLHIPKVSTALLWNVSLFIAMLFRIEGALFLLLLPFVTFFSDEPRFLKRSANFVKLYSPILLGCMVMGGWLILHPKQSLEHFGRLGELSNQLLHGIAIISHRYFTAKEALAQYVLTIDARDQAGLLLLLLMATWYVVSIVSHLSLPYAILVIYAWVKRVALPANGLLVLGAYIILNVLITASFLFEHFFLSKRYLLALSLTLMIWIPFALAEIIQQSYKKIYYYFFVFIALWIFIVSLGGMIDFGYSKSYIHQAGVWIAAHVPKQAKLYANDIQLLYYSNYLSKDIFSEERNYVQLNKIAQGRFKQYDYLALRLNKKVQRENESLLKEISLPPIKVFANKRGDRVIIYKLQHEGIKN